MFAHFVRHRENKEAWITDELKRQEKTEEDSYVLENIRYLLSMIEQLAPNKQERDCGEEKIVTVSYI